jgi:hypothetical protein
MLPVPPPTSTSNWMSVPHAPDHAAPKMSDNHLRVLQYLATGDEVFANLCEMLEPWMGQDAVRDIVWDLHKDSFVEHVFDGIGVPDKIRVTCKAWEQLNIPPRHIIQASATPADAGQVADQVSARVRAYFKDGNKSSNKQRFAIAPDDLRAEVDALRRWLAELSLSPMQWCRRPLTEVLAQKTGNCTEMTYMAAHLARGMGVRAEVWGFKERNNLFSHVFCVIGELKGCETQTSFGVSITSKADFSDCKDVWIADPWAGICCTGAEYDAAFNAKMRRWAAQNKQIWGPTGWISATSDDWLGSTLGARRMWVPDWMVPQYANLI